MTDVPIGLVRAYLTMIPRLGAEAILDHATAVGLGTGSFKDGEAVRRDLMMTAKGETAPRHNALNPGALALMGIKVESANG